MAALVFDLDGTLIDSAPDIHAGANRLLAQEGHPPLPFAQVKSFIGKGVPHLVERLMEATGIPEENGNSARLIARFTADYETAVTLTHPYCGVPATLRQLRNQGHRLGLCTNKPIAPTRAVLDHLDLTALFDIILGGDSLPKRKPDPAPLHAAIEGLGVAPALYIGDSETDAATALAADIPFLLYTEGYRKSPIEALPHLDHFSDFVDLPGLIAKHLPDIR